MSARWPSPLGAALASLAACFAISAAVGQAAREDRGVVGKPASPATASPSGAAILGGIDLPPGEKIHRLEVTEKGRVDLLTRSASGDRLVLVDTARPEAPVMLASLDLGLRVNDMVAVGDRVYLATGDAGRELLVVDVTTPTRPRVSGSFDVPQEQPGTALATDEHRLYLGTRKAEGETPELYALDVSSPDGPRRIGAANVDADVNGIDASGEDLFLATSNGDAALVEIDASDPAVMVESSSVKIGGVESATAVAEWGRVVTLARANDDGTSDLVTLEAEPSGLEVAGRLHFDEPIHDVRVHLTKALVATGAEDSSLEVVDLRVPERPVVEASLDVGGEVTGLDVRDQTVVVATAGGDSELKIVDPKLHYDVAVFGDSNTARCWFHPRGACENKWAELVEASAPAYDLSNFARQGSTACKAPGHVTVEKQIANAVKTGVAFDVGVLALGTNDLYFFPDMDPSEVSRCYRELAERLESLGMVPVVALTPPMYPPAPKVDAKIEELNAILREQSGDLHVDFFTGFKPELYQENDGVHFGREGQELRKRAFLELLSR